MMTGTQAQIIERNELNSFLVTMWVEKCGSIFVRSCEIIGRQFRNRTSFGENPTLHTAFSNRMAEVIKNCIDKLSMDTEVLALPNLEVEMPNLKLSGARLIATRREDGTVNIIMRFKSFIGTINAAFRKDMGFDTRLDLVNSVTATKVLNDIAMPLLNICTAIDQHGLQSSSRLDAMARHLSVQSHEIRFQLDLLKRFVMQQEQSVAANSEAAPTQFAASAPQAPLALTRT